MPEAELEALSTKQLLARLRHLLQCEPSLALSDRASSDQQSDGSIEFKNAGDWKEAYQQVKHALARREHVEKGQTLARRRRQRGQQNRTSEKRMGRGKGW
jgi:hypothetical protein